MPKLIKKPSFVKFLNVFDSYVMFFWDCSPADMVPFVKKDAEMLLEILNEWVEGTKFERAEGVCLSNTSQTASVIVWLKASPIKDVNTFAHECAHAVNAIMDFHSIPQDGSTNEIIATLTGTIIGDVLQKEIRDTIKAIT